MHESVGKWLMIAGALLLLTGIVYHFAGDRLSWIGRLPGDIRIKGDGYQFYFPLTTMILLSLLINGIIRLIRYFS